jgi:hypothetical protein
VLVGVAAWLTNSRPPDVTDIEHDWLAVHGALTSNAYLSPTELARQLDPPVDLILMVGATDTPHPRTPGALLLALPLALVPFDAVYFVWFGVNVALLTVLIGWSASLVDGPRWRWWTLAGLSMPVLQTAYIGSQSALVALLVLGSWALLERRELASGALLAAAICLKLWPAALLVPLLASRRYRPALAAIGVALLLNAAGMVLPGVSLSIAAGAFGQVAEGWIGWPSNASLPSLIYDLGAPVPWAIAASSLLLGLSLALCWLRFRRRTLDQPWLWIIAGLLAIPISWPSYDVVLVPLALTLAAAGARRRLLIGWMVLAIWVSAPWIQLAAGGVAADAWIALVPRLLLGLGAYILLDDDAAPGPLRLAAS